MPKTRTSAGEAYGFFYYGGKTDEISSELPYARAIGQAPSQLELELAEGVSNPITSKDPALSRIVEKAGRSHMSHVLKATLPGSGNRKASDELAGILNTLYTGLYTGKEPFYGEIAYKVGEKYVLRK